MRDPFAAAAPITDHALTVIFAPEFKYARSGDLSIAYQVAGSGPVDIVVLPGLLDHLETAREEPGLVRFIDALARFSRVVLFDRRGTGLSDRLPAEVVPTVTEQVDDVRAVMDAVGSHAAVILGVATGGISAVTFAVAHPERTRALVLYSAPPCGRQRPGYPWGPTADMTEQLLEIVASRWGSGACANLFGDESEEARHAFGRMERRACTPRAAVAAFRAFLEADVRDLLPDVRTPTLVVGHRNHPFFPVEGARDLAARIAGSRYVERDFPFAGLEEVVTRPGLAEAIEELVSGHAALVRSERVLVAVLFTDIVDSTAHAARLGDRRWHDRLNEHDSCVRDAIERAGGRMIKTTGDGVLARFDGAGRAVRCAQVILAEGRRLGLRVRAGVHAGDCEERGEDLAGLAVHVAARVAALAAAGEVLVTGTVRDLVLGGDVEFDDRGRHTLRGVPGEWALHALR